MSAFLYVGTAGPGLTVGIMGERLRNAPVPVVEVEQVEDLTDVNLGRHVPSSESGDNEDQPSNPLSISEERQDSSIKHNEPEVFMQFGPDTSYFVRCKDRWR